MWWRRDGFVSVMNELQSSTEMIRSVTAEDGYQLNYRVWAEDTSHRATLVLLNGIMSHSLWFRTVGESLASQGFRVVGADRRGSGLNQAGRGDALSGQILLQDLQRIIDREHDNQDQLYIVGWCWGGVLAIHAAIELGRLASGLILLAPGLFPAESVLEAMREQDRLTQDMPSDVPCLQSPIGEEAFTQGPSLNNFIRKDSLRLRTFTRRFHWIMVKMGVRAATQLNQLIQPILLLLASQDITVDNTQTLDAFSSLSGPPVTIRTCEAQHGMQFEIPNEITQHIVSWVARLESA